LLREEEIEIHGLIERAHDALGALGDRIELALGEIETRSPEEERDQNRHADEQHGERDERAGAIGTLSNSRGRGAVRHDQSAFFISSTMTLAASHAAIMVPKYMRSRRSMTPFEIDPKCVRNDSEAIASTIACGAQPLKRLSTRGNPESRKPKQMTTVKMNAITWLRVAAEGHAPIASSPPAIRKLPM